MDRGSNREHDHEKRVKALRLLEFRAKAHCGDCDKPHGMYMLRDDIWMVINGKKKGVLCIMCAVHRLGRPLTRNDFTGATCNDVIFYASTMGRP